MLASGICACIFSDSQSALQSKTSYTDGRGQNVTFKSEGASLFATASTEPKVITIVSAQDLVL